jgi:site-specific DNA-methyltransferase (adenine-specific)
VATDNRQGSRSVYEYETRIGDEMERVQLFNDHFQNSKVYQIPKAQLIIADIPYNVGNNAYGSSPLWYEGGDNDNGESALAGKTFFDTDGRFKIPEFFHFGSRMLIKEPKGNSEAPCMIVFCSFIQQYELIQHAQENGFPNYINLVFYKNFSPQVLKANMRVVGNTEYALILYRGKLPKFRNHGNMVFNAMPWVRDNDTPKIHPTQKPVPLLERLIEVFTDPDDVVIDPVAGSGTTLLAAKNLGRRAYGFEIKKEMFREANEKVLSISQANLFAGDAEKREMSQAHLFA